MPTSNAMQFKQHLTALSVIPVLALTLGAGELHARSIERPGTACARDCGGPAATGLEPATTTQSAKPASSDQAAPATPAEDPALTAGSRTAPAATRAPAPPRGKASTKPTGNRPMRRSGDRVVPPAPIEEPRRGGVGTLIGITFA
jgi:hypothetical protein